MSKKSKLSFAKEKNITSFLISIFKFTYSETNTLRFLSYDRTTIETYRQSKYDPNSLLYLKSYAQNTFIYYLDVNWRRKTHTQSMRTVGVSSSSARCLTTEIGRQKKTCADFSPFPPIVVLKKKIQISTTATSGKIQMSTTVWKKYNKTCKTHFTPP